MAKKKQSPVSAEEARWERQRDADTLRTAAEIRSDSRRMVGARSELHKQAKATQKAIGYIPKEAFRRGK